MECSPPGSSMGLSRQEYWSGFVIAFSKVSIELIANTYIVAVQSLSCVQLFGNTMQALCPPLCLRVCLNSCPLSRWCYPTISSSAAQFFFGFQSFPASGSFPMSQFFHIRWPEYWRFSFSISRFNERSELISFKSDWFRTDSNEMDETGAHYTEWSKPER